MLQSLFEKFISNEHEENNIIFQIFKGNLQQIIYLEGRYCFTNFMESKLKKYFSDKEIETANSFNGYSNAEVQLAEDKIYISKVWMAGIKGFINTQEFCSSKDQEKCISGPIINLQPRKSSVLFGWNGEGKSSLTEAIEFCLTGDVSEKTRRGKKNIQEYMLNTKSKNGYVQVELYEPYKPARKVSIKRTISKNKNSNEIHIYGSEQDELYKEISKDINVFQDYFAKHFIERNRIEKFVLSRGAENKRAYGDLLGLEELYDFIHISCKSYDTESKSDIFGLSKEAKERLNQESQILQNLKNTNIIKPTFEFTEKQMEIIKHLGFEEDKITADNMEKVYDKVVYEISVQSGYIKKYENMNKIMESLDTYYPLCDKEKKMQEVITENKNVIDLYEFYKTAERIINEADTECPLCGSTRLFGKDLVKEVKIKLSKLEYIKNMQYEINEVEQEIAATQDEIVKDSRDYFKNIGDSLILENLKKGLLKNKLLQIKEQVSFDKREYIEQLDNIKAILSDFITKYANYKNLLKGNQDKIKKIEEELDKLVENAQKEEENNKTKTKALADLKTFYTWLEEFYTKILNDQLLNISCNIKEYYNSFEKNQPIKEVQLYQETNEFKFIIKFEDNKSVDPLVVLSEGQLRCFGLSILLSIAKKVKASFLVMDDIVNAIDIEHRSNIINVLCNEIESKDGKQLIITTHDKLFKEKFVNTLNNKNCIKTYSFIKTGYIREDTKDTDFERKIDGFIKSKDCRAALVFMRIFLENTVYSMANGQVEVLFEDEVYKYKLGKVFKAVAEKDSKVMHIYNYFNDSNKIYWAILNQENHFWSEQSICLDCEMIKEIYKKVLCLKYIKIFNSLLPSEQEEIIRQKDLEKPDIDKFSKDSKIFKYGLINNKSWCKNFSELKMVL